MKPVKGQFSHRPEDGVYGDCHRAAIASVFEIDIESVPHFAHDDPTSSVFFEREREFLASRGLRSITIPFGSDLDVLLSSIHYWNPGAIYLLGGESKNGTNHTVVCQGDKIVHDPSPVNSGIVGPCDDGFYWLTFFQPIDLEKAYIDEDLTNMSIDLAVSLGLLD